VGSSATRLWINNELPLVPVGARFAKNGATARTRITAVKNIKKITSTMKLIAASRLHKVQRTMEATRPFGRASQAWLTNEYPTLPVDADGKEGDLPEELEQQLKDGHDKHLIVTITSDRGLCGGVNSAVLRVAKKLAGLNMQNTQLALIGDKSVQGLTREYGNMFKYTVAGVSGNNATSWTEISQIADNIFALQWDRITVIHNLFKSVITYRTVRRFFPSKTAFIDKSKYMVYEFEGEREDVLNDYYAWTFGSFLYASIVEAHATELGSRMASMDSASTNAGEVLKKLIIAYNKARQASVTTELTEIVSGAAAIADMESKD